MHTSRFSFRGALRDKLLSKLQSVTGPKYQTSGSYNATFSSIVRQVAERIVQCNRAFKHALSSGEGGGGTSLN